MANYFRVADPEILAGKELARDSRQLNANQLIIGMLSYLHGRAGGEEKPKKDLNEVKTLFRYPWRRRYLDHYILVNFLLPPSAH